MAIPRPALNARSYVLEIFDEHLAPFGSIINLDCSLMHDNTRRHVAVDVVHYLDEVGVTNLYWSPLSPDMSPIKHVWNILKG